MALATRCPYCNTTFRVTHDQLKLRGGLVRCGACKEIFNGVEHLLATQQPPAPASATATTVPPVAAPSSAVPAVSAPPEPTPPTAPATIARTSEPAPITVSPAPLVASDTTQSAESAQTISPDTGSNATWPPTAEPALPEADMAAKPSALDDAEPEPASARVGDGVATDAASGSAALSLPEQDAPANRDTPDSQLPSTTPEQDLDPLTRMTLMDMRPWPQSDTRLPSDTRAPAKAGESTRATDEIERALGELQDKPWRGSAHAAAQDDLDEIDALDNEEPDFVRQARVQAQRQRRTRLILALGSVLLALLALMQAAIVMSTEIAAHWPATMPALSQLCNLAGCKIGLPQQIEYVTIESHELQALPNSENGFLLSTLLRNRSKVTQAWPHLELTLNDLAEQPVARRVLAPADYLPAAERSRGMAPSSERPVRISFTLAQLKASGYRLYVFYP
jgi:predicted Zn finger-like uncharacterized protein